MKNFFKNGIATWIPIVILLTGGLFAANKIQQTQIELTAAIEKKLDCEIYDREQQLKDKSIERMQQQLDRIEAKIDELRRESNPPGTQNPGC